MTSYLDGQRAELDAVTARYEVARLATTEARTSYRMAKRERIATVNGEIEGGDAGIAWTNEERAYADLNVALGHENDLYQRMWSLTEDIRDAEACQRAELASYAG